MQYHISDGICCAKVFPFAVVGEDKVFLFLSKIGGASLIHLVALLCIIEQPAFQSAEQLCITPVCHRLECHFPACSKPSQEEK